MLVLQANQEQENTFNKLIQTMGEQVVWDGRFIVRDDELILEGTVRSLLFQFDTKKVVTDLMDLPIQEGSVVDVSRHPKMKDLINMALYAFGKWGTLRGLRVEQDYAQLNQLFSKILKMYYIEPSFRKENFRFYKTGVRITYEEVLQTVLAFEKKLEDDPNAESQGLWHKLIWKNRERAFQKADTTLSERMEDRVGNNFYLVGYECPKCSEKLHMAVYPEGKEVRIDTEEKGVYLARAYTCVNCNCFYTPRPDRLISEGQIYEMDFWDDKKAYEDYLELLGRDGERAANFKYNEYEAIRNQRLRREEKEGISPKNDPDILRSPQDALRQMEEFSRKFASLPDDVFRRFVDRVEEGFYPDKAVAKHEKKIVKQIKERDKNKDKKDKDKIEALQNDGKNAGSAADGKKLPGGNDAKISGKGPDYDGARKADGMQGGVERAGAMASGNAAQGGIASGNVAQDGIASGNVAQGGMASGNVAQGGMASGNVAQGGIASGNMAQGGIASGNMPPDNIASGNMALGNMAPGNMGFDGVDLGDMALDEMGQARNLGSVHAGQPGQAYNAGQTARAQDAGKAAQVHDASQVAGEGINGNAASRKPGANSHQGQGNLPGSQADGLAEERLQKYYARMGMLERLSERQKQDLKKQIQNDSLIDAGEKEELVRWIEEAEFKEKAEAVLKKAESSKNKTYAQMETVIRQVEREPYPDSIKGPFLEKLYHLRIRRGQEEVRQLIGQMPERLDRAGFQKIEEKLKAYQGVDLSPYEEMLRQKREVAEKQEIASLVKRSRKTSREDYVKLMHRLEEQNFADENVAPYMDKVKEKVRELDEKRLEELLGPLLQMDYNAAAAAYEQIEGENFLPELKSNALEMLSRRLEKIRTDECELLVRKLQEEMGDAIRDNDRHHFYPARKVMLKTVDPGETSAIDAALAAYANDRSMFEYPIFSVDTSRNFSGREGMVLTPENLFYSTRLHSYEIPISSISSIEASTGLLNRKLTLEETNGATHKLPYAVKAGEMEEWAKVLGDFVHYLQEKPASRKLAYLAKDTHDTICCYRCGHVYRDRDVCPECGYKENR